MTFTRADSEIHPVVGTRRRSRQYGIALTGKRGKVLIEAELISFY